MNCIGVLDSALGAGLRLGVEQFGRGRLDQHRCDAQARPLAVITPAGTWEGGEDGGRGSPHIRCKAKPSPKNFQLSNFFN